MKSVQILLFFAFPLCLASCNAPTSYIPELTKEEIRAEEIRQKQMVDEINERGGGLPKTWKNRKNMLKQFETVGERVEKAGAEICRGVRLQKNGCYYYFRLERNNEINAVADGKNIFIFTGMMRFVENDDQLAAVMAHELAHNLMGHVKAQENNILLGMLAGAAVDMLATSQGINTGGELGKVGSQIAMLTYSADFEREADYVGLYILAQAGYDPTAAANLWRRMSIEDPNGIYGSLTHPSNSERFVALHKAITEIDYKRKHNIPLLPDFKTGT